MTDTPAIAVIGAGSIGTGWAIVLAAAGLAVRLQDTDAPRLDAAREEATARLADLAACGLLAEPVAEVAARIALASTLDSALAGAAHVQECVPEQLELKQRLFARLDELAPADCPIASSSSFMPASRLAADLPGRARCLVVHPGNPPYLLRVAEVVPAPFTSAETVERAEALLRARDTVEP